ncbi:MAG: hypothetical protein DWQ04_22775 [Chloroflexi bacterium]|nr:MAG: hypothetical protein DWQ04_22775 [Chloroflexota bacterium]
MNEVTLKHLLLIDIDALRADVFANALQQGLLPNIERLLGGAEMTRGMQISALSTAPSITFCAQASLFTGAHPNQHGIPGNQFFDRFGDAPAGKPRFYAFDVGDTLQVNDAVKVFTHDLAMKRLRVPTIYEMMAERGKTAVIAGNMYANKSSTWLKPSLTNLGRFLKGGNLFGMTPEAYDRHILNKLLKHIRKNGLPHIITLYFMGLDFTSHEKGPTAQSDYLVKHIDPMIGELWQAMQQKQPDVESRTLVALFSDHGQIEVIHDDRHSLKLGFPFDREMASFFDAIGLDVHDFPGEAPNCNAVLALNGGTAHVYLHNHSGNWQTPPDFQRDVLPVGRAFWEAHQTGKYSIDLQGAISGVLLRNVEQDDWDAPYQALAPNGKIVPLANWFSQQPQTGYANPISRLQNLIGRYSGDILLISNYAEQFYFGDEHKGVHGGLHPDDSQATMAFGWPGLSAANWQPIQEIITQSIQQRCQTEGNRQPCITDLVTGLTAVTDQFWA